MTRLKVTPEEVDALLPQTQCGLCGYGGCMPYAEAIVFENAALNLCPPGGQKTLKVLGELLKQDVSADVSAMAAKEKPPQLAVISDAECIGCTKCIAVCPVDAIIGSAKQMHTVLADICTGCELCIPPCPVNCIDLVITPPLSDELAIEKRNLYRTLFEARERRLQKEKLADLKSKTKTIAKRKIYIEAALARVKQKRLEKI